MANDVKVLQKALKRFDIASDSANENRKLCLDDLKFSIGEQWADEMVRVRTEDARPCLVINRLPQFIRQVTNDMRMNCPQIRVAATDDSTEEISEIAEGMVRYIQNDSDAKTAFEIAGDFQVRMGFGYYRINTEYCDDESFEQDIKIVPINNPFSVYFDPSAQNPDYSDAKYCFVIEDIPKEDFEAQYAEILAESDGLEGIGNRQDAWNTDDLIRVAEYFEVVEVPKTLYELANGQVTTDKKAAKVLGLSITRERKIKQRKIIWRKMTSSMILEEKEYIGKYIPIVPVLGESIIVDGVKHLCGLVRYAKDPQKMYNYWSSAQTEAIALAPKAPFIIAEGQIQGYEHQWKNANKGNYSALIYRPTSLDGNPVPPPMRLQAEPPVQAMVQALQRAAEDMKATTGIYDASLGARGNETSGKAINARKMEGDIANYHYMDNLARSQRYTGLILLDLIPKIYDSARIVKILHEDGSRKPVKINQPTDEIDEQTGMPKLYDMRSLKADVVITTGASYQTKRQEMADSITQLVQAYPPLMQVAGDLMVKNLDWNGADEVAERLKKMLPPQLQDKEEGQSEIPPEVQQQLMQSQQMIEQLTQALNVAHDKLDNKADELESKERINASNNEVKLILEAMKHESDASKMLFTHELQAINQRLQLLANNEPVEKEEEQEQPAA